MFHHIENHDDFNEPPSRRDMVAKAPTFWNLMSGLLFGSEPTHYEPADPGLERIRAMQRGYDALNAAARGEAPKPSAVREIADEVIDHMKSILPAPIARALTARERAAEWLRETLANGPIAATVLERLADEAGVARRTLERARRKLGLKPRRIKGRSFWLLPEHDSAKP